MLWWSLQVINPDVTHDHLWHLALSVAHAAHRRHVHGPEQPSEAACAAAALAPVAYDVGCIGLSLFVVYRK